MATSAAGLVLREGKPLLGFVIGKYFEFGGKGPDYNGIQRNIEQATACARALITAGYLIFTPHLNTHHFEFMTNIDPDPHRNEDFYRAFDRRLLAKMDFVYASPNAWNSSGGRMEMQLAHHLKVPIFWNLRDLQLWAEKKDEPYSTLQYNTISEGALHFGEDDVKICIIEGPHWSMEGVEMDQSRVTDNEQIAEHHAVELFNQRIACFTPQQNASFRRLGMRMPAKQYDALNRRIITDVADALFLIPGWEEDESIKDRVRLAQEHGKPAFYSKNEMLKWRDGRTDYATAVMR